MGTAGGLLARIVMLMVQGKSRIEITIQDLPMNISMLVHSFNCKDYLSHVKPRDWQ